MTPRVSVVICTFNRAAALRRALASFRDQTTPPDAYDVTVVDNNSTDETADVVAEAARSAPVRYVREPLQGLSFARNRGIESTTGEIVAFTDDDVCVAADWVDVLRRVSAERLDAAWFGGRVLPIWPSPPPAWLNAASWAPLALLDFGPSRIELGRADARSVIGANLAVRRSAFAAAGLFAPEVQRVRDGVGSTEDHELQSRMTQHGLHGLYEPALVVHSPVDAKRMKRRYYRRWHAGHGRFFAVMRDASFEPSSRGRLFDVPAHVYRSLGHAAVSWLTATLGWHRAAAFQHELHARFLAAYARERIRGRIASMRGGHGRRVPA